MRCNSMMNYSIVIPARIGSTRFPRKVLASLCNKPVIQHVYERTIESGITSDITILTDSDEIVNVAKSFGAAAIMTSPDCCCGTERIASVLNKISGNFIINIQGDEPLLDPQTVISTAERAQSSTADVITPIFKICDIDDIDNPNRVKVAVGVSGQALYFSRSPIPFVRGIEHSQWLQNNTFYGHIGVYGYRRHVLEQYTNLKNGQLETAESLEQLRLLENGYKIDTVIVNKPDIGVDTPEDLTKAEDFLQRK